MKDTDHEREAQPSARRKHAFWVLLVFLSVVVLVAGSLWLMRGRTAHADKCSCEHQAHQLRAAMSPYQSPPGPEELAEDEVKERTQETTAFLLDFLNHKWEVADSYFVTPWKRNADLAGASHAWRSKGQLGCWERFDDHRPWPARPDDIQIVQSTCGHHDLFAFVIHTDPKLRPADGVGGPYTVGFFDLRLKDGAS